MAHIPNLMVVYHLVLENIFEEFLSDMGMAAIFVVQPKPHIQFTLSYLVAAPLLALWLLRKMFKYIDGSPI